MSKQTLIGPTASEEKRRVHNSLLERIKLVRTSTVALIQATKAALLNPFDFTTSAAVQDRTRDVLSHLNEVRARVRTRG